LYSFLSSALKQDGHYVNLEKQCKATEISNDTKREFQSISACYTQLGGGEKHRLRVPENGMLRILGMKRDEVGVSQRKLYKQELHNLYSSQNIIRIIKSG
jgi:hypothetical protein